MTTTVPQATLALDLPATPPVESPAESLVSQKVHQAQAILREMAIDCWIVQFAQETGLHPDPVQQGLIGTDVTWLSAFLIPANGDPIAIVGKGDVEKVRAVGAYPDIRGYVQGISDPLREALNAWQPRNIAITYSEDDHAADGITYGNYRRLRQALKGTPYLDHLVSAEAVVQRVRGRKLPEEVRRIRQACVLTAQLFDEIQGLLRPGVTGLHILDYAHAWMRERNLQPAWDPASCPCAPIGPRSPVGHVPAGDIAAETGDLIFCDVGVVYEGYRSDMQRTWYLLRPDEDHPPANIQIAWDTLMSAVKAGVRQLRPGKRGWQVDAAARRAIRDAGFPEPEFAFGHHLGTNAHDGGGVLGPRWERYGKAPQYPIEVGQVYAVEYAIPSSYPYQGWVSVEDDLQVTRSGVEWMVPPQRALGVVHSR